MFCNWTFKLVCLFVTKLLSQLAKGESLSTISSLLWWFVEFRVFYWVKVGCKPFFHPQIFYKTPKILPNIGTVYGHCHPGNSLLISLQVSLNVFQESDAMYNLNKGPRNDPDAPNMSYFVHALCMKCALVWVLADKIDRLPRWYKTHKCKSLILKLV